MSLLWRLQVDVLDECGAETPPESSRSLSSSISSCLGDVKDCIGGIVDLVAESSSNPACKLGTAVVSVGIGITLLVLSILSYMALAVAAADMQNLVDNWNRLPYTDMTTVIDSANCPTGFAEIPRPAFPGTSLVCDCPSGSTPPSGFKTPGIYEHACNSSQTWCTQYNALDPQTLQWRGIKFCAQTYADPNMAAFLRPRGSASKACPSGFFPCNANSSSTTEIFCTSVQGVCPLTSLAIVANLAQAPAGSNCSQFAGGASRFLCKATKQSPWPIVFSNFQTVGGACMPGADYTSQRSSTDVRSGEITKCYQEDTRWTVQDSQSPRSVYAATSLNGLAMPLQPSSTACSYGTCTGKWYARFTQAPASGSNFYYSASDFQNIVYASQPEVPWSQSCQIDRSRIAALVAGVQTVRKGTLAVLIIASITLVLVDILLTIKEFTDGEFEVWFFKGCITLSAAIGKLVAIAIQYEAAMMLGDIVTVAGNPCSDTVTHSSFSTLSTTIVTILSESKVMIAFAIITMLSTLKDCFVNCTR